MKMHIFSKNKNCFEEGLYLYDRDIARTNVFLHIKLVTSCSQNECNGLKKWFGTNEFHEASRDTLPLKGYIDLQFQLFKLSHVK